MYFIPDLHNISTTNTHPVPLKLQRIDISHNNFSELPNWIGACASLSSLDASHNRLVNVTGLLRNYRISQLVSLNLAYNDLRQARKNKKPPRREVRNNAQSHEEASGSIQIEAES